MTTSPQYIVLKTLPLLVLMALITLLPSWHFMSGIVVWFMDGQRLLELLLLCLIFIDAVVIRFRASDSITTGLLPINNTLRYAFLIFLSLAAVSAYLAQSPRHAIIEMATFIGLAYLALFVARLYHENKDVFLKRLVYILWASILLYMISFYVGYITATIFKTTLRWPFPFNGFTNVRHFNQYQLWGLGLICLPLLCFELKKTTRIWLQIALAYWWVLLFYSASRGALLAWAAGMLITAAVYQKSAWPFLRLQFINIFAGFLTYQVLFELIPRLRESTLVTGTVLRETANDRIGLWSQAIAMVKSSPWFGMGPMHFAWHYPTNAHPHNSILQLASEWGLLATFTILIIASYSLTNWLKRFNASSVKTDSKLDYSLAIILFFTLVANAAYSLVDGVIVMPISQVMMFTVVGLMIGHCTYGQIITINRKPIFRPIVAGIALIAMVWSTLPEIAQGLSGSEKGFSIEHQAIGPRFWREIR